MQLDAPTLQAVGVIIVALTGLVSAIGGVVIAYLNAVNKKVDKLIVQTDGLAKEMADRASREGNATGQLEERARSTAAKVVQHDKDTAALAVVAAAAVLADRQDARAALLNLAQGWAKERGMEIGRVATKVETRTVYVFEPL